jgi:ribose 5-phosphate isomerase B
MIYITRIYIASDHAGFELKRQIVEYLRAANREVEDCGPHQLDPEDDYPDYCYPCAVKVSQNPGSMGIVLGMSGNGEAIVANKAKGVRAALYYGGHEEIVKLSRQHNDANVLSIGAKFISQSEVQRAIDLFLETGFEGGRHQRRIDKISALENSVH